MGFCRGADLNLRCVGSWLASRAVFRKLVWSWWCKMGEDIRLEPFRWFERPFLMSCPNSDCSAPHSSPATCSTSVCMSPALQKTFSPGLFLAGPCPHSLFFILISIHPNPALPTLPGHLAVQGILLQSSDAQKGSRLAAMSLQLERCAPLLCSLRKAQDLSHIADPWV